MNAHHLRPQRIAGALGSGLPVLLLQFVICIVLLVVGVAIYTTVTPFHERELLREGNVAAATVSSGAVIALAIPLAALLATTRAVLDIVVWGMVAILLQLVTVVIAIAPDARDAPDRSTTARWRQRCRSSRRSSRSHCSMQPGWSRSDDDTPRQPSRRTPCFSSCVIWSA